MRILITNDDGIDAEGLLRLTNAAKAFAKVYVFAPEKKCSGMARAITTDGVIRVKPVYLSDGVYSYSVSGTPADCVRVAINYILEEKPDILLSGINNGFNLGHDIVYSGTIGAALEGAEAGIKAVAFSKAPDGNFETAEKYFPDVMQAILSDTQKEHMLINVNFPDCTADQCKGIKWNLKLSSKDLYEDDCKKTVFADGSCELNITAKKCDTFADGCDIAAVIDNYVAVGPADYERICFK